MAIALGLGSGFFQKIRQWIGSWPKPKQKIEQGIQIGLIQGERNGLELALEIKFGGEGLSLMERIRSIEDLSRIQELKQAIRTATTLEEVRLRLN